MSHYLPIIPYSLVTIYNLFELLTSKYCFYIYKLNHHTTREPIYLIAEVFTSLQALHTECWSRYEHFLKNFEYMNKLPMKLKYMKADKIQLYSEPPPPPPPPPKHTHKKKQNNTKQKQKKKTNKKKQKNKKKKKTTKQT